MLRRIGNFFQAYKRKPSGKIVLLSALLLLMTACQSEKYVRDDARNYVLITHPNDNVIRRVVWDSTWHLKSIEWENIINDKVKIFFFDSIQRLAQLVEYELHNSDLYMSKLFYDNGLLAEEALKDNDQTRFRFEYSPKGRLSKKYFYRKNRGSVHAWISFDEEGRTDLGIRKSHFLYIERMGDSLILRPCNLEKPKFEEAFLNVYTEFPELPQEELKVEKRIDFKTDKPVFYVDLSRLDTKDLKAELFIQQGTLEGYPYYAAFELYIKNLDSVPNTNLAPAMFD